MAGIKSENPKYKQIVKTAQELFYRYGIKRVSVEEICSTSMVSKMTFYKYFPNKIELAKHIFSELMDENEKKYDNIMSENSTFTEKVDQIITLKLDSMNSMSKNLINEILTANPEIEKLFTQKRKYFYAKMIEEYVEAQKKGDIRSDIRPEFILYLLNVLTELTKEKNLQKMYPDLTELVKEITNFFFYGILPRKAERKRKVKGSAEKKD